MAASTCSRAARTKCLACSAASEGRIDIRTDLEVDEPLGEPPLGVGASEQISLMSLYAGQYASYTTLLWQVPALGLTAQSFLLTIALQSDSGPHAREIASVLGALIAGASCWLMHDQRGRAINFAAVLRRLSRSSQLNLPEFVGSIDISDGNQPHTDAARMWDVDHLIYGVWQVLLGLLILADLTILVLTLFADHPWAK
jgi:hypothetical protein